MAHSPASHHSHERNLQKSLDGGIGRDSSNGASADDADVAARLAREAAEREAARRAQNRFGDAPDA